MKRFRLQLRTALRALALLVASSGSLAASFDCTRAGTRVEKLICAEPLLGRLDETLAHNYGGMLTVDLGRTTASMRAEQLGWLARRNRCQDVPCLVAAYRARIDETCDYGVAAGVHPVCSMADEAMAAPAKVVTPAPGACPISEREIVGHWRRTSRAGFHGEMAFESEGGSRRFDSWLHGRPEFSGGAWSLENCALHIAHPSVRRLDSTLRVLAYRKGVLSVREDGSQQVVVYARMP